MYHLAYSYVLYVFGCFWVVDGILLKNPQLNKKKLYTKKVIGIIFENLIFFQNLIKNKKLNTFSFSKKHFLQGD